MNLISWYKKAYNYFNGRNFQHCQLPTELKIHGILTKAHYHGLIRKVRTDKVSKIATWKFVKEL